MSATPSPTPNTPLEKYAVGQYGQLRQQPNPERLVFHFVPSLRDSLGLARKAKGADLTPAESAIVTLRAVVMLLPLEEAAAIAQERGYQDIAPESLVQTIADRIV